MTKQKQTVYELTIIGKQSNMTSSTFNRLPPLIGKLTKLTSLIINHTNIKTLPKEIGNLKYLEILDVSNNTIKVLPDEIGVLPKLSNLDISNNGLTSIPKTIGDLQELYVVRARNNKLKTIPAELTQAGVIGNAHIQFQELDFGNNKLTSLPGSFGNIYVEKLDLSNNPTLKTLPGKMHTIRVDKLYLGKDYVTKLSKQFMRLKDKIDGRYILI
jgi:leucine-rich repeat protein SHOC2